MGNVNLQFHCSVALGAQSLQLFRGSTGRDTHDLTHTNDICHLPSLTIHTSCQAETKR